jgi:hypothetical protein
VRRPQGYAVWDDPDRGKTERDTFTCRHCNKVVFVKPKEDPSSLGGFCRMCAGHVCARCAGGSCTPFEKKLEMIEARDRFRRSLG